MKQPNDEKTIELTLDTKRGRGRPSLANTLTPAERAKRYRTNKKLNTTIKSDETEIHNRWVEERERNYFQLELENKDLRSQICDLKIALMNCLEKRKSKKRLSDELADKYMELIKHNKSN